MHSAVKDSRPSLRPAYVATMSLTRLALPLYAFGCPENLLRAPLRPGLCVWLAVWVAAQAAVLYLQWRYGARCGVQARWWWGLGLSRALCALRLRLCLPPPHWDAHTHDRTLDA